MFRYLGLWLCVSIGLAGCASRGMMVNDANPATSKPDQAVVTLVFPRAISDYFSVSVYDVTQPQTKFIGILETGSKIAYPVPPGKHTLISAGTCLHVPLRIASSEGSGAGRSGISRHRSRHAIQS